MADTMYVWSDLYIGGEANELPSGRKLIKSRNIIARGEEVTLADIQEFDEDFDETAWDALVEGGSIRDYPLPEGYNNSGTMSPYTFILEQRKRELEEAEEGLGSSSVENILLRASVVGTQMHGPSPEEVLLPGVEEVPDDDDDPTLTELRARASELEIEGRSSMNKEELAEAIAAAEE